jgi:hypothetical protein
VKLEDRRPALEVYANMEYETRCTSRSLKGDFMSSMNMNWFSYLCNQHYQCCCNVTNGPSSNLRVLHRDLSQEQLLLALYGLVIIAEAHNLSLWGVQYVGW